MKQIWNIRNAALFVFYSSFASPAYAYLDPATGSIILQAIVGAVGTWIIYSRNLIARARDFAGRLSGRKSSTPDNK